MDITNLAEVDWILLAQRGRAAGQAFLLLLALFQSLAGLAAIIGGALLWVAEKSEEAGIWASIAAFGGGAWCGYGWFGWPFVSTTSQVMTSPGGFFSPPMYETVTNTSFSIFALLGNGVFGIVGCIAMFLLAGAIAPELFAQNNGNSDGASADGDEKKSRNTAMHAARPTLSGAASLSCSKWSGRRVIAVVRPLMAPRHLVLCGLLLFAAGCDDIQRGGYVVSSHGSVALSPECSELVLISGSRNTREEMGDDHLLLAVIAFSPGFQVSSSSIESDSGAFVTSIRRENHGAHGSFNYNVAWNRADETVVLGSREFRRTDGNVFFLLDDGSPEHLVRQIPGIIKDQSVGAILEHARRWSVDSDVALHLSRLEARGEGGRTKP